jgi:zinc transport system permease protein
LFGDLLTTRYQDAAWIALGGLGILLGLYLIWRPLLNCTINIELAKAEGVPTHRIRTLLLIMLAITVAIGMKVVGALLITAMLIIPAASARRFASTPEQMAVMASGFGLLAVLGGIAASVQWDTPAGPSIVLAACFFFIIGLIRIKKRRFTDAQTQKAD